MRVIQNAQGLTGRQLSKQSIRQQTPAKSGYFTVLDYTQVSPLMEIEEPYLKPLENGMLIVRSAAASNSEITGADVLDLLTGSKKAAHSSVTASESIKEKPVTDLIDILSTGSHESTQRKHLSVELVTDGSKVSAKSASKFLQVWKDLVERGDKWRALL